MENKDERNNYRRTRDLVSIRNRNWLLYSAGSLTKGKTMTTKEYLEKLQSAVKKTPSFLIENGGAFNAGYESACGIIAGLIIPDMIKDVERKEQ